MTAQRIRNEWWGVSEWEFREAVKRMRSAMKLPRGERVDTYRRIASDYGVSFRTLYRWVAYDVRAVKCGEYAALFVISGKRPSQVTPWEKVA